MSSMRKIWINRAKNYKEASEFDSEYYSNMSANERLEIVQYLRNIYKNFETGGLHGKNRKRLQRTIKIIKQA